MNETLIDKLAAALYEEDRDDRCLSWEALGTSSFKNSYRFRARMLAHAIEGTEPENKLITVGEAIDVVTHTRKPTRHACDVADFVGHLQQHYDIIPSYMKSPA